MFNFMFGGLDGSFGKLDEKSNLYDPPLYDERHMEINTCGRHWQEALERYNMQRVVIRLSAKQWKPSPNYKKF